MKKLSGGTIAGEVHMVVSKAGGEVVRELTFPNIVLDVGYKELIKRMAMRGSDYRDESGAPHIMNHLFLGTGTTEPTFGDTGLESRSGTLPGKMQWKSAHPSASDNRKHMADSVGRTIDFDNNYFDTWYKWRFAYEEGEAEGVWTELGLAESTYSYPFTRALIRDEQGAPISLTILSDEYLTVFYTIRFISEPQHLGAIEVDGATSTATFIPGARVTTSSQTHNNGTVAMNQSVISTGTGSANQGGSASFLGALSNHAIDSDGYTVNFNNAAGAFSGDNYSNVTYQGDYLINLQIVLEPTDEDEDISALVISNLNTVDYRYGNYGFIIFDPPLNKRADYRVTIDVDLDMTPEDGPVTSLASTATSSSIDFTWGAYPNATEYQLVLRQAGTVIEEQTVTAESASFTGLTASTEYHLDIKPIATPRNGRRLIHAASTTA